MLYRWMVLLLGVVLAATGAVAGCRASGPAERSDDTPTMQVELTVCGEPMQVQSRRETVGQLLYRLGLPVSGEYRVSEDLFSPVSDGMRLRVDWLTRRMEVYCTPVGFETLYCRDPSLPKGQQQVLFVGREGQKRTVVETFRVNDRVCCYQVQEQILLLPPVAQVVAVGTGEQVGSARSWPLFGDDFMVFESGQVLPLISDQNS